LKSQLTLAKLLEHFMQAYRKDTELPAGVLLSDLEIKVLQAYAQKKTSSSPPTSAMQSVS
jgi:hypothetical protein